MSEQVKETARERERASEREREVERASERDRERGRGVWRERDLLVEEAVHLLLETVQIPQHLVTTTQS